MFVAFVLPIYPDGFVELVAPSSVLVVFIYHNATLEQGVTFAAVLIDAVVAPVPFAVQIRSKRMLA